MIKFAKTQKILYYSLCSLLIIVILIVFFPDLNNTTQTLIFIGASMLEDLLLKFLRHKKIVVYI